MLSSKPILRTAPSSPLLSLIRRRNHYYTTTTIGFVQEEEILRSQTGASTTNHYHRTRRTIHPHAVHYYSTTSNYNNSNKRRISWPNVPMTTMTMNIAPAAVAETKNFQRRSFARSSIPEGGLNNPDVEKAITFIVSVGYEREVAQGDVDALKESGLSGDALLATARQLAGRWEVGEDEGLEPLAASVQMALKAKAKGNQMIQIHVVPAGAWKSHEGQEDEEEEDRDAMMAKAFTVDALQGTSLTDVAKFGTGDGSSTLGEMIECACSGIMACSTCHVVIDEPWFDKVGEPTEAEQDMLDLAYSVRRTSRLGCQVVLDKDMDGLVIKIPRGANNLMDFIPFGE
eukprot:scaffold328_cov130-Cylindrotheca_fusiformis.AAC.14